MRTNIAKKIVASTETHKSTKNSKPSIKLVEKFETSQYDELVGIDYEAFLLQYGVRSDFA